MVAARHDKSRRSEQVYGAGEYVAKNPSVSIGYFRCAILEAFCRILSDLKLRKETQNYVRRTQNYVRRTQNYVRRRNIT